MGGGPSGGVSGVDVSVVFQPLTAPSAEASSSSPAPCQSGSTVFLCIKPPYHFPPHLHPKLYPGGWGGAGNDNGHEL